MDPGEVLVRNSRGEKVMQAVNGLHQVLRSLAPAQRPDLRARDKDLGNFFRTHVRLPCCIDSGFYSGMKRVRARHQLNRHVRDDVPLLAVVTREFVGVYLAAAEDSKK